MIDFNSQKFVLYIGNKNYSSWSMRPWIILKMLKVDFEEILIPLYQANSHDEILKVSPSGKLSCLHHNGHVIWDFFAMGLMIILLKKNQSFYPYCSEN